eukprot:15104741-Alexandrium_andersonii.AAC.1
MAALCAIVGAAGVWPCMRGAAHSMRDAKACCLQTVAASGPGNAVHRAGMQALRAAKPTAGPPD